MNAESKLLIDALRAAMRGQQVDVPEQMDWTAFLRLAKSHSVEGLVYSGLQKDRLPEQVDQYLRSIYHKIIFRDAQLEHMKAQLQSRLTEANVPHVFLKGACLKYNYPIPALRTMSDLDILVHTENYDKIDAVGKALGGELFTGDGNHRNFRFPSNVIVEFHPNILHQAAPVGTEVNPGWQYAKKDCPTSSMELTEEGFYLSIICHMAEHFVSGGVGVRFVLDVWVFRNLRKLPIDTAFLEEELKRAGLLEFTRNIERLAEAWFGNAEMDPLLYELEEYILTSGSHGTNEREMLNAVSLSKSGTRGSVLWGKVFYPRKELEDRFPWAKGKPWLLPAAWCVRAFKAVTTHGNHILAWTKGTGDISSEEIAKQRDKMARFGIRRK